MVKDLFNIFSAYWPELVSALVGFIISFFLYLKSRVNFKQKVIEKDTENIMLQQIIASGSFVVCPKCGEKIYLSKTKVYTGGQFDEN